jgi:cell division septum initiation protein DivIVA
MSQNVEYIDRVSAQVILRLEDYENLKRQLQEKDEYINYLRNGLESEPRPNIQSPDNHVAETIESQQREITELRSRLRDTEHRLIESRTQKNHYRDQLILMVDKGLWYRLTCKILL